ncbi:hypothetical protein DSO57_1033428 [Entomophthora muscae]|uniref:Uncharacterized protein n=1 Tax=Entomophthora muscae TaxID=34485 RepID=A0ACC2TB84_9FUNG|nr:hypothetical protein DSO57_1033428 [Entomophthora muscae]
MTAYRMKLFGLLASLAAACAKDFSGGHMPAYFHSYPYALSTISDMFTTLYSNPKDGQKNGAKFPYTKVATKEDTVNLASVFLVGGGFKYRLKSRFALIPQNCSCYWIDASRLKQRFPTLRSGYYQLSIEENGLQLRKYYIQSGIFALRITHSKPSIIPPSQGIISPIVDVGAINDSESELYF